MSIIPGRRIIGSPGLTDNDWICSFYIQQQQTFEHLLVFNLAVLHVSFEEISTIPEVWSISPDLFDNQIGNPAHHTSNSLPDCPRCLPVLNKDIHWEDCSDSNFPTIYNSGFRLCAWFVFLLWIKELNNGVRAVSAVFSCIMFTTIRYHIRPGWRVEHLLTIRYIQPQISS